MGVAMTVAVPANGATSPLSAKSPAKILSLTSAAMIKAGSFHYDQTASIAGAVVVTLSTDSSSKEGAQTQTLDGAVEKTRLIGSSLYIYASKKAYLEDFGVKNSTLASEWVSVPKSNKNYASISAGLLLPSVMSEMFDVTKVSVSGSATVNGVKAVVLKATESGVSASSAGSETMYIAEAAPYRPIGVVTTGKEDGSTVTSEIKFTKWGDKLSVHKPTTFVTATSKTFP
jgi:hypothetical protein